MTELAVHVSCYSPAAWIKTNRRNKLKTARLLSDLQVHDHVSYIMKSWQHFSHLGVFCWRPNTFWLNLKARSLNSCNVSGASVEKMLHHTNRSVGKRNTIMRHSAAYAKTKYTECWAQTTLSSIHSPAMSCLKWHWFPLFSVTPAYNYYCVVSLK
jgi:hypothetical protein